jgi:hypothetical protein
MFEAACRDMPEHGHYMRHHASHEEKVAFQEVNKKRNMNKGGHHKVRGFAKYIRDTVMRSNGSGSTPAASTRTALQSYQRQSI